MRFLFVEDQLRDACSHHLQYLQTIVSGAHSLEIDVIIAANVAFAGGTSSSMPARPVLRDLSRLASSEDGRRWQRQTMLVRNITANAAAIAHLIKEKGPFDCVFCLTTWWPQLASLLLAKWRLGGNFPPLGLLFVNYPRIGQSPSAQFRLVRWLVKMLGRRVTIFAETKYAQRSWAELLGRRVEYVVHPAAKPVEGPRDEGAKGRREGSEELRAVGDELRAVENRGQRTEVGGQPEAKLATRHTPHATSSKPLIFGFYGFARHEQGVDVLMEALEILQRRGDLLAEFRVLWPQGFRLPDGRWMERSQFEHLATAVRFIDRSLEPEEYLKMLGETDWLVLPYRVNSYEGRCSRISIEACVMGIPVIYTRGTDLEEVLSTHGAGISVGEEDAEALADAIRVAMKDHDAFHWTALERREQAQEFFSGRRFIEQVLKVARVQH